MSYNFSRTHGESNDYQKTKYCHGCGTATEHIYDPSESIHICSECEL